MEVYRILFYGGMTAAAGAAVLGAAAWVVFRRRAARLRAQLEREYGPREKKDRR